MKTQITISLAQIKKHSPSLGGWSKVLKANGGVNADLNKEFPVSSILDSNDLDDTLWVLRCLPEYAALWRKFAWWCAAQSMDNTTDERVSQCLEVVKRYSEGLATDEELLTALSAARSAAPSAARSAAARSAALAAARSAASRSAAAALSAARSAEAALSAARSAAAPLSAEAAALSAAEAALPALSAAEAALSALSAAEAAALSAAEAAQSAAQSAQEIKLRAILDSGIWKY